MISEVINYKDLDGNDQTMTARFNMNLMDIADFANDKTVENLQEMAKSKNIPEMIKFIEGLVKKSYGFRRVNPDTGASYFAKATDAEADEFLNSDAGQNFILELVTVPDKMNNFIIGVFPTAVVKTLQKNGFDVKAKLENNKND